MIKIMIVDDEQDVESLFNQKFRKDLTPNYGYYQGEHPIFFLGIR